MRSTPFEVPTSLRLPPEVHKQRLRRALQESLTPVQREIFLAYYLRDMTILEIARERGVNKSTVWRTLLRAEQRLKRQLQF